jgi:hypothetical protein
LRLRWFGASGRRVPEIAVEGDATVPLEDALVVDGVDDVERIQEAHRAGTPVVVRARTADEVQAALARPEVACALVPESARDLVDLDLPTLTYG